jgi:hypothetical protein
VSGNLKVAFKLDLLLWHVNLTLIWLLNKNNLITVAANHFGCFWVTAILKKSRRN